MTTINLAPTVAHNLLAALVETGLRRPTSHSSDKTGASITWDPDLTPAEQATLDVLLKLAVGATLITPAEADAIRDDIVVIRDLRQLGRNAFMALTAADRDRALYDAQSATTTILLAILRE